MSDNLRMKDYAKQRAEHQKERDASCATFTFVGYTCIAVALTALLGWPGLILTFGIVSLTIAICMD